MDSQTKQDDHLNNLLEDALDDLLLADDEVETIEQKVQVATKGIGDGVEKGMNVKAGENSANSCSIKKEKAQTSKSTKNTNPEDLFKAIDDDFKKMLNAAGLDGTNLENAASGEGVGPGTFGPAEEEEMNKFFQNMAAKLKDELPEIDPKEAQAKINESVPQIFDLMQNLLSKQLLYPALKDLSPKFDEWLKKNSPGLSKTDKKRYRKQKEIIDEIIYVFDDETLDDRDRFEKNLDLMEKMQTLGSPPKELTVPEGMNKCSVM